MVTVALLCGCSDRSSVAPQTEVEEPAATDTIVQPAPEPVRPEIRTESDARALMTNPEDSAKYNAGILPRMLDEVPEYAIKLLNNTFDGFIVVDKYTMRVILYDVYGNIRKEYKMACSKNYGTKHRKADNRTPEGFFTIEGIYDSTDWLYTDDDGRQSQVKGQFGPRFLRLKIPVTSQIGIHGTNSPGSLGGRRSHGCIRIANENILELAELVEPGMPVIVSPGRRDMAVNEEEGYDIPAVTTGSTRPTPLELPKKEVTADTIPAVHSDTIILLPVDTIAPAPVEIEAPAVTEPADTVVIYDAD